MNSKICSHILASSCLVIMISCISRSAEAQNTDAVERWLGQIVADGDLTLEQAHVMLRALHEFSRHQGSKEREFVREHAEDSRTELLEHFERLGFDEASVDRVQQMLGETDIEGERRGHVLRVVLRLVQMMRSSDEQFEMPDLMREHFRSQLKLSDQQIGKVFGIAKRLSQQGQHRPDQARRAEIQQEVMAWIESLGDDLKEAVERGDLSEREAWEKWEWIKGNQIGPKTEAAVEKGQLSREQGEEIWNTIEKDEAAKK
ncbi:hypothetical protein Poly51_55640 [Rubripirellula tenax]|uniref:Uncharacterized protein n=2 Tax=Rubripirellula tenax TaxID=2528015 RepID=A0A5C6EG00_9BACT|nr:hypothetical protein Poly51_55640 [Rubripirellula tenax]